MAKASMAHQDPRDREDDLLRACQEVVRGSRDRAAGAVEANVFRVAAGVLPQRLAIAASRLRQASQAYLREHPADTLEPADVVRKGWVVSLPRLRQALVGLLEQP